MIKLPINIDKEGLIGLSKNPPLKKIYIPNKRMLNPIKAIIFQDATIEFSEYFEPFRKNKIKRINKLITINIPINKLGKMSVSKFATL